ncbi:TIR domain-containing protein [Blastococcus sp. TF02-8]|uniref:TIR domain-containing protein n=1 Tax=Blastococcus sp. TF02-8 TaxID=2250574 RepID=UPI001412F3E4|nr:TIR domain-containing protein [Blastococcus sp. TF02-8]
MFISYRQSDGAVTATRVAWLLRAAGVPVWQDDSDLAPGHTEDRLNEALETGLSGAVLVVTPDIVVSPIVRNVELPAILDLNSNPDFVLAIANTVRTETGEGGDDDKGKTDFTAPDRLLGKPRGTLSGIKQYAVDEPDGLLRLLRDMLTFRAGRLAAARDGDGRSPLHLSVQTRAVPHAFGPDEADFSIRVRPPEHGRLPNPRGLHDLRSALRLLPQAVARTGARSVRITGGAHLSAAFALGAALPATLIGDVKVEGTAGDVWTCGTVSRPPGDTPSIQVANRSRSAIRPTGQARNVLAYVQLVPAQSDAAYTRFLDEHHADFDAWETLVPTVRDRLDPGAAGPMIEELAGRLRALVAENDHAHLHLLLHAPFPVAVLLGRLCNTLNVTVYEWNNETHAPDGDARPQYVPCLTVNPTSAQGPITDVLLPTDDSKAGS